MRNTRVLIISIIYSILSYCSNAQDIQHTAHKSAKYYDGVIMPKIFTEKEMEDSLYAFYNAWKKKYIKLDNCCSSCLYVYHEDKEQKNKCVSEGQGYGLVIVAYMADYDKSAKCVFDSLYRYYEKNRVPNPHDPHSKFNYLMSGYQKKRCNARGKDAATDGDLDIAYSLLLADAQWGSKSGIDYFEKASNIASAILAKEINEKTFTVLKGNAIEKPDENEIKDKGSPDYFDMRSSDFMPAHFSVFKKMFNEPRWGRVIDSCYKLFDIMQERYSKETGLVPDFIQNVRNPKPAISGYEETNDGMFAHNACRVPWRIATDFILNGDPRSKKFVEPINKWIRDTSIDDISEGYHLNGIPISDSTTNFPVMSYVCPFAVSAMVDSSNLEWLNKLYKYIIGFKLDLAKGEKDEEQHDYYNNTIKMFTLIILSGKYWTPERN